MENHAGASIEKVVRRSGISIAELARRIKVNRRSIYNWFEQETISFENIYKIGAVLGHDFSEEFPELPKSNGHKRDSAGSVLEQDSEENVSYWKNKYIALLEEYNDLLIRQRAFSEENAA